MIEFPMIEKIVAEERQKPILNVLERRFDSVPVELKDRLTPVRDEAVLEALLFDATDCTDLAEFEQKLQTHIPQSEGTS